ncbi:hypothetical protein BCR33DRAFT_763259, partial [Rhizoclosmatium globosum]
MPNTVPDPTSVRRRKPFLTPSTGVSSDSDADTISNSDSIKPKLVTVNAAATKLQLHESKKLHSYHKRVHSRRTQFSARVSPLSEPNTSLRGFITFFWMGIGWYSVFTLHRSFMENGEFVRPQFLKLLGHDAQTLAIADAVLVLSCGTCVLIQGAVKHGFVGRRVASIGGHVWLVGWFVGFMMWILRKDWRWTQTGYLTLHCIAMLMKQHSYLASNSELFWKRDVLSGMVDEIRELEESKDSPVSSNASTLRRGSLSSLETDDLTVEAKVVLLKAEADSIKAELKGKWNGVEFPNNITVANFVDYMLVPTLVYELSYPRTEKFNPSAFLERVGYTFISFFLLCTTVDQYILPILHETHKMDFFTTVIYLIMPFMVCFMMIFFIVFECICNAFAELTCFADREFYQDWWNSSTFDEYARRWNKPVHEFLLRHVYLESISTLHSSKQNATLLTFFVSSVFHELAITMIGKRVRPWLFGFQMFQIPLIWLARLEFMKRRRWFG